MNGHTTTHSGEWPYEQHMTHPGVVALKRISWGAVFAGTLMALVAQLLFSLLGFGIGMGTVDPASESNPMAGLGTGSMIWWCVTMLISLFIGGWAAGRLAGIPRSFDSMLHGILSYCLFTLLSFYLLTSAVGRIISGVGSAIGKTVSAAGQGLSQAAPEIKDAVQNKLQQEDIDLSSIKQEAQLLLAQTGKPELQPQELKKEANESAQNAKQAAGNAASSPQTADQSMDQVVDELFASARDVGKEVDRDAIANVIAERTGKSKAEANEIAGNWITTFNKAKQDFHQKKEEAKEKAEKAADDAASAASKAGIFGFVGLILGAAAAGVGGRVGKPDDIVTDAENTSPGTRL